MIAFFFLLFFFAFFFYRYCCLKCAQFYHNVLVFVPGGAVALSMVMLAVLVLTVNWKSIVSCYNKNCSENKSIVGEL